MVDNVSMNSDFEELPEQANPLATAAEVQDQKPCERHAGSVEDTDKTKPEESLAQPAHSGPSTSSIGESRWRRNAASAEAETRSLTPSSFVLLRSGLRVPVLGLGTRQLKGAECREAVRMALRSGYRLIDTAPGFGNEEEIANGIRAAGLRREDVFLVTKLSPAEHGDAEEVEEALGASLQRLGTGYIDLFLIQSPQGGSVIWTWDAVLAMRDRGLARAVGVCNFSAAHLAGLAATGRQLPEVLQVELHLAQQQQELTAHCAGNGIAVMAASPLARGQLCRSSHGSFPDAWRSLAGMAAKKGRSQAEIALRWCLQKGYIALPKSKSQSHLEANAAFGFDLTSAEMTALRGVDCHWSVSSSAKCLELSWEQAVAEHSEVSEGDVGEERPRRRRRRRRKGKGKGKGGKEGKGKGGRGPPAAGTAAQRAANTLFGLS
eukprot:s294_g3.t1